MSRSYSISPQNQRKKKRRFEDIKAYFSTQAFDSHARVIQNNIDAITNNTNIIRN